MPDFTSRYLFQNNFFLNNAGADLIIFDFFINQHFGNGIFQQFLDIFPNQACTLIFSQTFFADKPVVSKSRTVYVKE